jgi:hypothetical protein
MNKVNLIINYWIDEYGAKYSVDKKILLHIPDEIKHYTIHPNTERLTVNFRSPKSLLETIVLNDTFLSVFDLSHCRVKAIIVPEQHKEYTSLDGVVYSKDRTELVCYPKNKPDNEFIVPHTVEKISSKIFFFAKLSDIKVDKDNKHFTDTDGVLLSKDRNQLVRYPRCKENTSYIVPETVEIISDHAFRGCKYLESIILPERLKTIGSAVFSGCSALTSLFIPRNVENLSFDSLPKYNYTINIQIDSNNENYIIFDNVIYSKDKKTLIWYRRNNESNSFTIPDTVEVIGKEAFANCNHLTNISMTNIVTIEENAFSCCENLTIVRMSEKIEKIGRCAFFGCDKLQSVEIKNKNVQIERNAFKACNQLIENNRNFVSNNTIKMAIK